MNAHLLTLLLTGFITPLPALWHVGTLVQRAMAEGEPIGPLPTWVYLLLWLALIEIGYAVYLMQLPDWSSLAVAAVVLAGLAAIIAVALGLTMFARPDNAILALLDLVPDSASGRRGVGPATTWCLVLVCLTSLLALWFGQDAADRRRADRALAARD